MQALWLFNAGCNKIIREVLASTLILNLPERVDWKNCSATKEEETVTAEGMRTGFKPFDFTDDD